MVLRIALLGAGIFALQAHLPAIERLKDVYELVAVYSRSEKSATTFSKAAEEKLGLPASSLKVYHDQSGPETDLSALLSSKSIDAVVVLLPITTQPQVILKALAAGKHVLSEKPVAGDVASGLSLIKNYEENYKSKSLIWRVAENFECEPSFIAARDALSAGKIGKVTHWRLRQSGNIEKDNQYYNTAWRTVPDYQGGFLLDGGVHSVATVRTILGTSFKELSGFASLTREHLAPHDTIHALIRCDNGTHGIFDLSFALPPKVKGTFNFTVTGTEGLLQIEYEPKNEKWATKVTAHTKDGEELIAWELMDGVYHELKHFAAVVAGNDDGKGAPRGVLEDVAVIQASLSANGSLVNLHKLLEKA